MDNNNYEFSTFDQNLNPNDLNSVIRCDIYEKNNSYVIEMELPGFKKNNISVGFNDGYLTVIGTKEEEKIKDIKEYIRRERLYGKFERQFFVGKVTIEKIDASFHDGVLKIVIPKVEDNRNLKNIRIK